MNSTVKSEVVIFLGTEEMQKIKVDKLYYLSKQRQILMRVIFQFIKTKEK